MSIYIFNLKERVGNMFKINPRLYSKILHVNFNSSSPSKYCCYVACQCRDIQQIQVYDFMEDLALRKKQGMMNHGQEITTMTSLNFHNEPHESIKVMIANDFNEIIFSNGKEKWIMERKLGYYT